MGIHIGIFTASGSFQNLLKVEKEMRELCDITYIPYSNSIELLNLYLEQAKKFDGLLFSGMYPYDYIREKCGKFEKPCVFLDLTERDLYLMIARIYARNPNQRLEKIIFSISTLHASNQEEQEYLEDIFAPQRAPKLNITTEWEFYKRNINTLYESSISKCLTLWNSGNYELVVTRLTNAVKELEQAGIPYMLVQPCRATIMEFFRKLLTEVKEARMESALTGYCVIQIANENVSEKEKSIIWKVLEQFNTEQNMSFVLRQNGQLFEAVTSKRDIRRITSDYTTCFLTSYLYEMLPFSTYIGWGMGYDIVTAHQNALRAIQESKRDPHRYTYMVNELDEMVGPLCGDRTISYQLRPSARANHIAKKLGISAINLEKLISLQKNRGMMEFSASDLVFYLDITPRSATRILKKLAEHGAATQVNSLNLNGRGRPAAIYEIDFDKIEF